MQSIIIIKFCVLVTVHRLMKHFWLQNTVKDFFCLCAEFCMAIRSLSCQAECSMVWGLWSCCKSKPQHAYICLNWLCFKQGGKYFRRSCMETNAETSFCQVKSASHNWLEYPPLVKHCCTYDEVGKVPRMRWLSESFDNSREVELSMMTE